MCIGQDWRCRDTFRIMLSSKRMYRHFQERGSTSRFGNRSTLGLLVVVLMAIGATSPTTCFLPMGPTAAFAATPTSANAPLSVQFTDASDPGTETITSWAWNFGDGGTSVDPSPTYVYETGGTYSVALTVATGVGSDTETLADFITVSVGPSEPVDYTFEFVQEFPHDRGAFTQGLAIEDGVLYEGTGLFGGSSLRRVDLATGEVLQQVDLGAQYFGEGITVFGDRIIQLTWRNHKGFVYDLESFELLEEFSYTTEGWGLTHDGTNLVMSDGTNYLYFLDPVTFERHRSVPVFDGEEPVFQLNELECIDGYIFANVWKSDDIARIDPESGFVVDWIEIVGLLSDDDPRTSDMVLNGIAYDADADRLFVTGKLWPKLFEIQLVVAP